MQYFYLLFLPASKYISTSTHPVTCAHILIILIIWWQQLFVSQKQESQRLAFIQIGFQIIMNILEKQMHIYAYVACNGHWSAYDDLLPMCQLIRWSLCHHQRQVDPPRWSHKRPSISQGRPRAEDSHPLSKVHSIPHLRSSIPHRRPREEYSHGDIQQSQYPTWDQVSHSAEESQSRGSTCGIQSPWYPM